MINTLIVAARMLGGISGASGEAIPFSDLISAIVITAVYSIMGAIIVVRTGGNRVGWLMILLGFAIADPFAMYLELTGALPGTALSRAAIIAYWTQGWFFFLILYVVFLILLHFPDGRTPGGRWRWIRTIPILALAQYILVYTFQPQYGDETSLVDNPIALLSTSAVDTLSGWLFGLSLILLAAGSLASVFFRFRKAGPIEKAQIKWLLFSAALSFSAIAYRLATYVPGKHDWTSYLLTISLASVAAAICIAILRYRLYDIEIIIRRTLQYALLTGTLVVLYFGGVVILQGILGPVLGATDSPLITVITTLIIAALFNPLHARSQEFIDRRFFRKKYDAEKALSDFAVVSRDEVNIERLSSVLLALVDETMQPDQASLWLRRG